VLKISKEGKYIQRRTLPIGYFEEIGLGLILPQEIFKTMQKLKACHWENTKALMVQAPIGDFMQ